MNAFRRWLIVLLAAVGVFSFEASAHAQAARTWVSGAGNDVNPCSRTAPCRTFAAAITRTPAGGEIDVLDDGAFGAVVVDKAITIDGHGKLASIFNAGTHGIAINAGANDAITIRNLSIAGGGTGLTGIRILTAGRVSIEDCTIYGQQNGISAATSSVLYVSVRNTVVRGSTGSAIGLSGGAVITVVEGSSLYNNKFGIAVATQGTVVAVRTTIFGSSTSGVESDGGGGYTSANA